MISDKQQEILDSYLQGNLSKEEMEQELSNVPDLMNIIQQNKTIMKSMIQNPPDQLLRRRLQERGAKIRANAPDDYLEKSVKDYRYSTMHTRLSIAASLLVLVSLSSFYWAMTNYSNRAVADAFFEAPLRESSMSQIPDVTALYKGKNAFFAGDYQKADDLLQQVSKEIPALYYEAQVFSAYTSFQKKEYLLAISKFDKLIDEDFEKLPNAYKEENRLRWNRLLAYIGNKQMDTPFFQSELKYFLSNKSEYFQRKAKMLKNRIDSPWRKLTLE